MAGRKFEDLSEHYNKSNCYCLNEDPSFGHGNLFIGDESLVLKSEADEQLLIHLEFKEAVKIHSISLKAPKDGMSSPCLGSRDDARCRYGAVGCQAVRESQQLGTPRHVGNMMMALRRVSRT
ncbi:hypothetical protein, variant 2 [Aphanomyces invadans]|uniref:PITH domain-containing protein n=1 Tax=Aphanomyces invadans TaxID=157072 RepID=A0A024TZS9_9STRA|nr:hypothetical protein, variant 2 [Aphanomyces invadans]ETV99464.1 hypothetical protein, variant 2 [Aphanomyces invadans]|eukprot:XP_008872020.1 hypothetical protein, variant 2 [Aphanomyces invadans]